MKCPTYWGFNGGAHTWRVLAVVWMEKKKIQMLWTIEATVQLFNPNVQDEIITSQEQTMFLMTKSQKNFGRPYGFCTHFFIAVATSVASSPLYQTGFQNSQKMETKFN